MLGSRSRRLERRIADLEAAGPPPGRVPGPAASVAASGGGDPFSWMWGGMAATRSQAMAVPTLAYIRAQLAGGVSSMPLERYRYDPTGSTSTKLDPGWCREPDPAATITRSLFWAWVIDDLFFNGRSTLVVLARDATSGFPIAFRRVLPGQLIYSPETLAWGTFTAIPPVYYLGADVPPEDVIAIDGPHEGICNYGGQVIKAALDLETSVRPPRRRSRCRTSTCTRPAANPCRRPRRPPWWASGKRPGPSGPPPTPRRTWRPARSAGRPWTSRWWRPASTWPPSSPAWPASTRC